MQPVSKSGVVIDDFNGLSTNDGPIATGERVQDSAVQVNLMCISKCELKTRPGLRPVTFDEDE